MGSNYVTIQSRSLDTRLFWNTGIYSHKLVASTWPKCEPLEEAVDCSAAAAQHKHTTAQPPWPPGIDWIRSTQEDRNTAIDAYHSPQGSTRTVEVQGRHPWCLHYISIRASRRCSKVTNPSEASSSERLRNARTQIPFKACRFFLENGVMVSLQGNLLMLKGRERSKEVTAWNWLFWIPISDAGNGWFQRIESIKHESIGGCLTSLWVKAILGLLMSCGTWGI